MTNHASPRKIAAVRQNAKESASPKTPTEAPARSIELQRAHPSHRPVTLRIVPLKIESGATAR